ncbi:serine/threonine/tyrosine-interacting-like protein 1 [Anolis carolinensis]|uniref:Tyrosine-protein phosphatase domain-containing protein n=1 Tax=Anolis carolinensis TaxID=28377 RepID=H9G5B8_ANOCA|nr:PREDICTED: serine/threonine/tyrosine-interacting-like protein 1 [Anolis carolinensis]XP_008120875.1 PREDICTED: serine/threonine/tyrosine-interacting-like protein 1 [Anolis carolinensis]XP_008120876.1 PREDICTED: serine/threonine/tyrosine-interacting-like protein 1 [Anolis carolinensis]XP_008120877.1 PREDICTED: serine/threonine/tyrosine-interacting-like protein 1 [Anolis carolinensis]|eukprot:XP_008120874.1 PREDICTED: serine/threonine/tyrosine-interacting-like protein 1 [Anolis carolinensis]
MAGVTLCEPNELYNLLNQATRVSRLAEPNYLCLLDARSKREYNEDHLVTAIRAKTNALGKYLVPQNVNLECVRHCVVYDGVTGSVEAAFDMDYDLFEVDTDLKPFDTGADIKELRHIPASEDNTKDGSAARCARVMQRLTRFPVLVLRGGYQRFTRFYHYLRTQKIIWMPQELEAFKPYPVEILPMKLYMGNFAQACDSQIQKDLKIKAHINLSEEDGIFFIGDSEKLLHIPVPDSPEANIFPYFSDICHFIDSRIHKEAILVFSTLGISRSSTAVMAYLIHSCRLYLKNAWTYLQKCKGNMRPNRGFVKQLSEWEERINFTSITNISEPNY